MELPMNFYYFAKMVYILPEHKFFSDWKLFAKIQIVYNHCNVIY